MKLRINPNLITLGTNPMKLLTIADLTKQLKTSLCFQMELNFPAIKWVDQLVFLSITSIAVAHPDQSGETSLPLVSHVRALALPT